MIRKGPKISSVPFVFFGLYVFMSVVLLFLEISRQVEPYQILELRFPVSLVDHG